MEDENRFPPYLVLCSFAFDFEKDSFTVEVAIAASIVSLISLLHCSLADAVSSASILLLLTPIVLAFCNH